MVTKKSTGLKTILSKIQLFVTILPFVLLSGCASSSFNCTPLESVLGGNTDLIKFSYKIAENLTAMAMPPLTPMHPGKPILFTTLVDNNNLQKTTKFGRILQEHVSSRFVQLGYTVREIKLENQLHITERSGETMLTRESEKLSADVFAQAIFVGTFSQADRILYISTRLINPKNGNIIASDDYRLCMDEHIINMFGLNQSTQSQDLIEEPKPPFLNSIFY